MFLFCRLVITLAGDDGLKHLAAKHREMLKEEGSHVSLENLELLLLNVLAEFLYVALKNADATTLVVRWETKYAQRTE